jgi:glycine/D-amino acid oxidase-like deaminating enzyme
MQPEGCAAAVIGGGFYGTSIAAYLARRGVGPLVLVEQAEDLFAHASFNNQARVHNGYHYPRSFTTAFRSRVNLPRFLQAWPAAVRRDFTQVYAISRLNSKVTARQFERFCRQIGATFTPAPASLRRLFEPRLIEDAYVVEEYAFDARTLAEAARQELRELGVAVRSRTHVDAVRPEGAGYALQLRGADGTCSTLSARYVFNCTYAGLNQIAGLGPAQVPLKQEITEMALVAPPPELRDLGVTVMDGPFFSFMPFPARGLHSLSHVRYTPHMYWKDQPGIDPYERLAAHAREPRVDRMLRDAARYLPSLAQATYVESLFEVKTVLERNEADDGRPILFEKLAGMPGCYSILGGKIDNLFDVLEKLDAEPLHGETVPRAGSGNHE